MTDEVRRYLRKAEHALEVAEDLLKDGHVPDAASKTYYAMYYAAQALLTLMESTSSSIRRLRPPLATILPRRGKSIPNSIGC